MTRKEAVAVGVAIEIAAVGSVFAAYLLTTRVLTALAARAADTAAVVDRHLTTAGAA